ncbi:MAG: phospholipid carrier-dependent glycosyltransferase [Oscillatoriales cyanobacterium RM2_1_1]|nr:phospholipid carrier-dependent glycosyltransferase [Oscillatoriales cyanobacterium SM2_3_0]NJO47293.1 phospholipid carrier-dependent glycosyltransferase [Oscillatoriales cyanobacterium RM2_1_1]
MTPEGKRLGILGLIWILIAVSDRLWFAADHNVPAWDQADYLTGSLNYWYILQSPQWGSEDWWRQFWQLSPKIPPFTYLFTGPWLTGFGLGADQANLVHLAFSGILLSSVYGLGMRLLSPRAGLWGAGLCALMPGLYVYRLQYLLDYPLTAMVTLSFACLTCWRLTGSGIPLTPQAESRQHQVDAKSSWLWAVAFGISLGLGILTKQTAVFFLGVPILWVVGESLGRRAWKRLAQLGLSGLIALVLISPWVRTNWLLIVTSGKRATLDSALAEGDPDLTSWQAWVYYWNRLPEQISWPLLLVPLVGLLWFGWGRLRFKLHPIHLGQPFCTPGLTWLAIFWLGGYFLCSLNINKDPRYSLPLLPVFAMVLAHGLTLWPKDWGRIIRWGTVGLALGIALIHLWPVGGSWGKALARSLSPEGKYRVYLAQPWPHQAVIDTMIQTEPWLQSTLGVLPSTAEINQHNFSYFGALRQQQVFGRQVGTQLGQVPQDALSLSWFVSKTETQGSVGRIAAAQAAMVQAVEQSPQFQRLKQWPLPDGSGLNLYHRQLPYLEVTPQTSPLSPGSQVQLTGVMVPEQSPPGKPMPVTYTWVGPWEQLQSGLVLLTWKQSGKTTQDSVPAWIHDHSFAMGTLPSHPATLEPVPAQVQVIERMGMLPPADLPPGNYQLEATYLNRNTGETYGIPVPPVTVNLNPNARALPAPELDLVTQLRQWAQELPEGVVGLEQVFAEVGRVNQYDPTQNYTVQAEQSLAYRLQQHPEQVDWAYGLALAQVLQQDAPGATQTLQHITQLDTENPFAHGYLAFIHLYRWQPRAAEREIQTALTLKPDQIEFQALRGIAYLMQGHFIRAWKDLQTVQTVQKLGQKS